MKNWQKRYPPYEGSEPYLYFAFAEADSAKAWQIMRILLERGCRVWYGSGPSGNADELLRRQERAEDANLTLLYLTDAACADKDTKSNILVNQKNGKHILCLDPDGADRRLSMGLYETVPHLPLYRLKSRKEIENEAKEIERRNKKEAEEARRIALEQQEEQRRKMKEELEKLNAAADKKDDREVVSFDSDDKDHE